MVQEWFEDHNQFKELALSPNSPDLNPIKIQQEFKSRLGAGHHNTPFEVLWRPYLNESEPFWKQSGVYSAETYYHCFALS